MKNVIAGLLLSASAVTCYAGPVAVEISFQGAIIENVIGDGIWDPSARLEASFTGQDRNNDQFITFDELTKLQAFEIDFLRPNSSQEKFRIFDFRYRSNEDLTMYLVYTKSRPDGTETEDRLISLSATDAHWYVDNGQMKSWTTDPYATTISIVSSVPEPSGVAMSVIGLGLAGLSSRRRARAAQH